MPGRTIAIGDIHGCDAAFVNLLAILEVQPDDTVVLLGDLCDRGPDTRAVIDRCLELQRRCNLKLIFGNHDEMMLGSCDIEPVCDPDFWKAVGGDTTLQSYGGDFQAIPETHIEFLASALPWFQIRDEIFIHASLDPGRTLAEQDGTTLRWKKIAGDERPWPTGQRVVCGHTSQKSGKPLIWPGWICLDTRVYDTGWLTAFDCGGQLLYQAHSDGERRGPTPLPG